MADEKSNANNEPAPAGGRQAGGGWVFPALLVVVLAVLAVFAFSERADSPKATGRVEPWIPSSRPRGEVVQLEIDYGNGATKAYAALPWREAMTVADVLTAASEFRPGITFEQKGQGPQGLLTSLDGVQNQGAGSRNWLYEVDGEPGDASFSVKTVDQGQRVRWRFAGDDTEQ